MPTYQYACTECGHTFDQVQSFTDDSLTDCPECQGRLRKLFNAVGVVFKGSGFYRNDSRKPEGASASGSSGASEATSEGTAKTETKTGTKTESKSEAKPAAKTGKNSEAKAKPAASTSTS